jgi:hypothetical protein
MELDGILARIETKIDTMQSDIAKLAVAYAKVEERLKLGAEKLLKHDEQIEELQELTRKAQMNNAGKVAIEMEKKKGREMARVIAEAMIAITAVSSLVLSLIKFLT